MAAQLLLIYKISDSHPPTDIFLDISKAFDNVWHEALIFGLKVYDVDGYLLKLL